MKGRMCRGNTGHTMCIITYHKAEQKPKGKVYFPQNSFGSVSSHNWQRFRQGPLMVKFRIKKIFIDNISFKNVW